MGRVAMIAGLLGQSGAQGFLPVFATLLLLWVAPGMIMKRFTRGTTPQILVDVPPYRPALLKNVYMRMRGLIREAIPCVLLGVVFVNLLCTPGVIGVMERVFESAAVHGGVRRAGGLLNFTMAGLGLQ